MKRTAFLVLLCLCLMLGACFATAGAEGAIEISTKEQLKALVGDVAADANKYQGKTVKLLNDIDLGGDTWTPIDTFKGEFDGNGKTIRNFKIDGTADGCRVGFFNVVTGGAYIHNLTLQNVTATVGNGRLGTLAYRVGSTNPKVYRDETTKAENIIVKDVTVNVTNANAWIGGMAGCPNVPFTNSTVENLTVNAPSGLDMVGGFATLFEANWYDYKNCNVNGFKLTAKASNDMIVGGFAALTQTKHCFIALRNCAVTSLDVTLTGNATGVYAAGFIGCMGAYSSGYDCSAQGIITAPKLATTDNLLGGFLGDLGWGEIFRDGVYTYKNCSADVDIITDGATAGGFAANSTNSYNRTVVFENCTAKGDVTSPNGIAGGFAGLADRGTFTKCKATGLVNGKIAGGFIGEVHDKADMSISMDQCSTVGTVQGSEKAGGLVGNMGAAVKNGTVFTIKNSTAAPAVIGAKKSTQVAPYLNSTADSKPTKTDKLSGKRTTANPTDGSKALAMDQNGNVTIPEGGADVQHTDDPELKWIPAGSIIHRDGSITLPGEEVADEVTAVTPPRTGVDSADRFIPMALLSLLCMAALVTLRRKERRS